MLQYCITNTTLNEKFKLNPFKFWQKRLFFAYPPSPWLVLFLWNTKWTKMSHSANLHLKVHSPCLFLFHFFAKYWTPLLKIPEEYMFCGGSGLYRKPGHIYMLYDCLKASLICIFRQVKWVHKLFVIVTHCGYIFPMYIGNVKAILHSQMYKKEAINF